MNSSVEIQIPIAVDVRIEQELFYVRLEDGREIGVPYQWYWRLAQATNAERLNWRFISDGAGIHWEDIDEDISIEGILKGNKNPNPPKKAIQN
ncbi:MAG: DUF2442 domain-containing protein [Saprospiraceae bacterium]|nr:DUF2442 domain-containing protein [Saprospiraceae bacterium]